jgi:cysteinyl-tRNA synthetase
VTDVKDSRIKEFVAATSVLRELSAILGLFRSMPAKRGGASEGVVPKLMDLLIELRKAAREKKDFATGDQIRNSLAAMGITLEDAKGGATSWRMGGTS